MAGLVDHTTARVEHRCRPPAIHRFGDPRTSIGVPTRYTDHPEGTRFHCDACGTVWVVWLRPPTAGPRVRRPSGLVWRPETRRERRRRLGLRWWRR